MLEDYLDVLTANEVREILFIGKNKLYDLLQSGEIKCKKVGRNWRILKKDLIAYLNENDL